MVGNGTVMVLFNGFEIRRWEPGISPFLAFKPVNKPSAAVWISDALPDTVIGAPATGIVGLRMGELLKFQ